MKTKFLFAVSICLLTCGSCQKDSDSSISKSNSGITDRERIAQLINRYKIKYASNSTAKPNAWITMGVDLMGAWQGGEWGAPFGPWGAGIGACVGGVISSCAYAYGRISATPNCTTCSAPINEAEPEYDLIGRWYNQICDSIRVEQESFFTEDSICFTALTNRVKDLTILLYNQHHSTNHSTSITPTITRSFFDNIEIYLEEDNIEQLTLNVVYQGLMNEYFTGINYITELEDLIEFTTAFQNIIIEGDYPEESKQIIIQSLL